MATATRTITYDDQETALTGFFAWDDAVQPLRPGLLLVHGGAGLDDHAKGQAKRYAAHGYAVLACDMYGGAMHGFTHEHTVPGAMPGVAYNALADQRSFLATRTFLAEVLTRSPAA